MVKVYNKCKRLTICARDAVSAQTMQSMFTADIESVNDIVAYLSGRIPVQTQRKRHCTVSALRSGECSDNR